MHRFFGANCWTTAKLIPGAYRCLLGHNILDPCWQRISSRGVYCFDLPWRHVGIVLRGRQIAVRNETGRHLWGVHTTDGYGCVASPGANPVFHGHLVFYRCAHQARWLYLAIDKRTPQWHATEVLYSDGHFHGAHRVGITKAWYGVSPFGLR